MSDSQETAVCEEELTAEAGETAEGGGNSLPFSPREGNRAAAEGDLASLPRQRSGRAAMNDSPGDCQNREVTEPQRDGGAAQAVTEGELGVDFSGRGRQVSLSLADARQLPRRGSRELPQSPSVTAPSEREPRSPGQPDGCQPPQGGSRDSLKEGGENSPDQPDGCQPSQGGDQGALKEREETFSATAGDVPPWEEVAAPSSVSPSEAEEEAAVRRLAGELERLRAECPEVTAYSQLPFSVRQEAQEQGITLLDAYLRFQHRERQRVARAKADSAAAAQAGMGELSPTGGEQSDPVLLAALRGVWG